MVIVCPTWTYNKAYLNRRWIFTNSEQVFLVDPLDWYPSSKDQMNDSINLFVCLFVFSKVFGKSCSSKDGHVLFIINDCSADKSMTKKKQLLSELASSGRHVNCSVWVLTQKCNSVLTDLREQTKWTALFYIKD